ncbi:MAG: M3 family metallopeptidase [Ignavibacteriota bacterium]
MSELSTYLDELTTNYLAVHTKKENAFWEAKMGLGADPTESQKKCSDAEVAVSKFIQDAGKLKKLRELEKQFSASTDELIALDGWKMFFEANVIEDPKAQTLAEEIINMEGALLVARGGMGLGYIDPKTGEKVEASTNALSNMLISEKDEAMRKAAYEGLATIGPFILTHGFIEIVKKRNELGRLCGYEDYYDYKVQKAEGITKKRLFTLLDDLEIKTRESNKLAVENFIKDKGESARQPWNFSYARSGDLAKEMDPYHPFSHSLERWARSFSTMNIKYRNATLTLDLVDRAGKYENGFMHAPMPSFFDHGKWNPAHINFTANAIPNKVGSGFVALNTLFHEGGHAAHFSNVLMNAPCFGQEFAPTSVAYAETQSMFCDSVISDADWLVRYAKNDKGEAMPFELIAKSITQGQPFHAMTIRAMLGVCYAEKALYQMSESELNPENIQNVILEIEQRMYALPGATRPILAVPHLVAGESSAYYHGYVLAEMAVQQTREYFMEKYGYIADNPHVGPELENGYWRFGNSIRFFDLVERFTGKPLKGTALIAEANRTVAEAIAEAKRLVEHQHSDGAATPDLRADIKVIHGNEKITEFTNGDFGQANEEFRKWVVEHYPKQLA